MASKIDVEFDDFMSSTLIKVGAISNSYPKPSALHPVNSSPDGMCWTTLCLQDSNLGESGLGYEEVIKSTYGGIYGPATSAGTKKVKVRACLLSCRGFTAFKG